MLATSAAVQVAQAPDAPDPRVGEKIGTLVLLAGAAPYAAGRKRHGRQTDILRQIIENGRAAGPENGLPVLQMRLEEGPSR